MTVWLRAGSVASAVREHTQVGTNWVSFGYRVVNSREFSLRR